MKNPTIEDNRVLRIVDTKTAREGDASLCAIPHIQYLRDFDRVQWDPAVMGLGSVGKGCDSTLVACPSWALDWLNRVECLRQVSWDIPLSLRRQTDIWSRMGEVPSTLKVGSAFVQKGGFVNYWMDEDREHLLWGTIDPNSATSLLAFVWLQNVLAGGRPWRRRELGNLSESFVGALPIGYLSLGRGSQPLKTRTFGSHLPVLELLGGQSVNTRDWLASARDSQPTKLVDCSQIAAIHIPPPDLGQEAMLLDNQSHEGVIWRLKKGNEAVFGIYPATFAGRIDDYQNDWKGWLRKHVSGMSVQKETEILLCTREAALNADKHGCAGGLGKRVLVSFSHDSARRLVKVRVSDPGKGHTHNIHTSKAREEQMLGRHLGLMLIHGLASSVRFSDEGSTIEFDFAY